MASYEIDGYFSGIDTRLSGSSDEERAVAEEEEDCPAWKALHDRLLIVSGGGGRQQRERPSRSRSPAASFPNSILVRDCPSRDSSTDRVYEKIPAAAVSATSSRSSASMRSTRSSRSRSSSRHPSDEDDNEDFEASMERELTKTIERRGSADSGKLFSRRQKKRRKRRSKAKDILDIDTQSSSDDEVDAKEPDELYDSEADDKDEAWWQRIRSNYLAKTTASSSTDKKSVPEDAASSQAERSPMSDAVLNCPCCMALLSLDCQRHTTYRTQYRAMFVFNCRIDHNSTYRYEKPSRSKNKRRQGNKEQTPSVPMETSGDAADSSNLYKPVLCSMCESFVALQDCNEVYHFFNVLSSHS